MNRRMQPAVYLLLLLCLQCMIACKKGKTDPSSYKPVVYPTGQPAGAAVSKMIDGSGGTLTSADNRITVTIPQGALTAATSISVQPISNTLPASPGLSYRLLPEGVTFSKPVNITFHYTDEEIKNSSEDVLSLAYQDKQGYWYKMKSVVDRVAKTITVQTTHFSDWAMLEEYFISITPNPVKPGATAKLEIRLLSGKDSDDALLHPLGEVLSIPLQPNETLTWKLVAGNGSLKNFGPGRGHLSGAFNHYRP